MSDRTRAISDVRIFTPPVFKDARGTFAETYSRRALEIAGINATFLQDNESVSVKAGTIRGLHYQKPPQAQGKLVRVVVGAIYDVAVDIRRGSPTFGQHVAIELSAANRTQIWVPVGFAHGFCTLEPNTVVLYKTTNFYAAECESGLRWDDPDLGIGWPVDRTRAILSDKDLKQPAFGDLDSVFSYEA